MCIEIIKKCEQDFWPSEKTKKQIAKSINDYIYSGKEFSIKGSTGVINEFEEAIKAYYNVKFALATNSGTSAMHAALTAVGIGEGDEVVCQTSTFHAAITPILHCGGIPVLCDIELKSGNIDCISFEAKISKKTKAVVITHLWGFPANMEKIIAICKKYNIKIIEDCSHAHATIYHGKKVGTFGDIAIFSLQESKMVFAGEGGVLITNNRHYYEIALLCGQFGNRLKNEIKNDYLKQFWETGLGLKYRMHPFAAICANISLCKIENVANRRSKRNNLFNKYICDFPCLIVPREEPGNRYSYFGNKVYYDKKKNNDVDLDEILKKLKCDGFNAHKATHRPLNSLPFFTKKLPVKQGVKNCWGRVDEDMFNNTKEYFSNLISFPRFENDASDHEVIEYSILLRASLMKILTR